MAERHTPFVLPLTPLPISASIFRLDLFYSQSDRDRKSSRVTDPQQIARLSGCLAPSTSAYLSGSTRPAVSGISRISFPICRAAPRRILHTPSIAWYGAVPYNSSAIEGKTFTETMKTAFRFSRQKETIPTSWTYPGLGEHDGAQVWKDYRFIDTLSNEGSPSGWNDGFDYNPKRGYDHILLVEVSGFSGDSGKLRWNAITEKDVEAVWMMRWKDAQRLLWELDSAYYPDKSREDFADMVKKKGRKVEPNFARTITDERVAA